MSDASQRQGKALAVAFLRPILAALVGLALGVGVTYFSGENPFYVAKVLFEGAFGSPYSFGMTLFYTTPLIFTGLAVALPFHAGLFNIGAEGQLLVGSLGTLAAALVMPQGAGLVPIVISVLVGFGVGAAYGAVAGWIRAYRGGHEVISTIMLNFVAAGITSWVVLNLLKSTDTQNPESAQISMGMMLHPWAFFEGAPMTSAFVIAILACIVVWILLRFTVFGYNIRASGQNPEAARVNGINVARTQLLALALAGGLAGLVGIAEIFGNVGRFRIGFSADYGFIGIPVALLARCHPIGVIFSAFLFGALHKGSSELDLETDYVTRDVSYLIQAFVILAVSADGIHFFAKRRKKS